MGFSLESSNLSGVVLFLGSNHSDLVVISPKGVCTIAFDHTLDNPPDPVPNSEVKLQWACLVLGWGTTRESHGVECVLFLVASVFY